jgi:hypothetical protein
MIDFIISKHAEKYNGEKEEIIHVILCTDT